MLSKQMNLNPSVEIPIFDFSYGFYGRVLTQIKMKPSKLNNDLFLYNITDNPFCPKCFHSVEDPRHYFLECNSYSIHRTQLL